MSLLVFFIRVSIKLPKTNTPKRPIYIKRMMIILPIEDREDVIPVLNPTVPSADVASNIRESRGNDSVSSRRQTLKNNMIWYEIKVVSAESTRNVGKRLWQMVISLLSLSFELKKANTADIVVDFTPPPVPDGEAPINIAIINTN